MINRIERARLAGRDHETWISTMQAQPATGSAMTTAEELEEWANQLGAIAVLAARTHDVFNQRFRIKDNIM
jgi:hypothetical protein